mmetsp:Transcript_12387/g.15803  ORF Transcript_12387/g.15803 Transcript_12387/m.15803 type:complete len:94 (+) Transcript_12387:252-533(+)
MLKTQGKTEDEMQRTVNMLINKVRAAQQPEFAPSPSPMHRSNTEKMTEMKIAAMERVGKECERKKREKEVEWNEKIRKCQESLDEEKQALNRL